MGCALRVAQPRAPSGRGLVTARFQPCYTHRRPLQPALAEMSFGAQGCTGNRVSGGHRDHSSGTAEQAQVRRCRLVRRASRKGRAAESTPGDHWLAGEQGGPRGTLIGQDVRPSSVQWEVVGNQSQAFRAVLARAWRREPSRHVFRRHFRLKFCLSQCRRGWRVLLLRTGSPLRAPRALRPCPGLRRSWSRGSQAAPPPQVSVVFPAQGCCLGPPPLQSLPRKQLHFSLSLQQPLPGTNPWPGAGGSGQGGLETRRWSRC